MFSTNARESLTYPAGPCRHRYIHKSTGPSRWWDKQIINKTSNILRARAEIQVYRQPQRTISSSSSFSPSYSSLSLCQKRNDCFEFHEGANEFMVGWRGWPRRLGDFKRLLRPPTVTRFTKVEEAILIILTAAYFTSYNSLVPMDSLTAWRVLRNLRSSKSSVAFYEHINFIQIIK